ncbi:MAG: hypothetical protein EXS31_05490 [Pedosphaera sp.]|nr:hypothetical protein [Pedosphaera sp.]
MKSIGIFSKWIGCGIAVAILTALSTAQAATGKASVTSVRGTASYSEKGGDWKPLKSGMSLSPGASVKTGVGSQVELDMGANGALVRLTEDTTLGLDRLELDKTGADSVVETQLDLRQGTIQGIVRKLAAASKYEIKTPNTVAGVRGACEYEISADGVTHILNGAAMVAYTNPVSKRISTHQVNEGQTFIPPLDPNRAEPTLRATRANETRPSPRPPGPTPTTAAAVVPVAQSFISPIVGQSTSAGANANAGGD